MTWFYKYPKGPKSFILSLPPHFLNSYTGLFIFQLVQNELNLTRLPPSFNTLLFHLQSIIHHLFHFFFTLISYSYGSTLFCLFHFHLLSIISFYFVPYFFDDFIKYFSFPKNGVLCLHFVLFFILFMISFYLFCLHLVKIFYFVRPL
jgi:hypothetical protein